MAVSRPRRAKNSVGTVGRRRELLADSVYSRLKKAIVTLKFPPGMPLREEELARIFRASRTPIREAFRRLHSERLVEIVPGRGASVGRVSFGEIREAYEIRELLEPFAAKQAAQKSADSDKIQRLIDRLEAMHDDVAVPSDLIEREEVDQDLHRLVASVASNALLGGIVADMRGRLHRVFGYLGGQGRFREARQEHLALLRAIQRGDGESAADLMREHIRKSKARLLEGGEPP